MKDCSPKHKPTLGEEVCHRAYLSPDFPRKQGPVCDRLAGSNTNRLPSASDWLFKLALLTTAVGFGGGLKERSFLLISWSNLFYMDLFQMLGGGNVCSQDLGWETVCL